MRNLFDLAYLIPLLPFIGFLINGLGRNVLSKTWIGIIGSGVIFISFCLSVLVFITVSKEGFTSTEYQLFPFY